VEGQGEPSDRGVVGALVLTLSIAATEASAPLSDPEQAEAKTFISDAHTVPPVPVTPLGQVPEKPGLTSPFIESLEPTVPAGSPGQPPVQTDTVGPSIAQDSQPFIRGHGISRRQVLVGLAALAAAGGGLTWWVVSQNPTNPPKGTLFYTYRGHSNPVKAVAWSPNGSRIASGSNDNTVQVWSAADGSTPYTYQGHIGSVDAVAWSPDGSRIASGSDDSTVQMWQGA
jgi:hypothetical protein